MRPVIVTPRSAASLRTLRVSSAATTPARDSSVTSRAEASSGRPIGTPARINVPQMAPCAPCPLPILASLHIR